MKFNVTALSSPRTSDGRVRDHKLVQNHQNRTVIIASRIGHLLLPSTVNQLMQFHHAFGRHGHAVCGSLIKQMQTDGNPSVKKHQIGVC